jgi:hypothetical protein
MYVKIKMLKGKDKNENETRRPWLMPVILATQEAEIRRMKGYLEFVLVFCFFVFCFLFFWWDWG